MYQFQLLGRFEFVGSIVVIKYLIYSCYGRFFKRLCGQATYTSKLKVRGRDEVTVLLVFV